jgi:2'-5' RNA ligase
MVRAFIAVGLDEAVRRALGDTIARLRETGAHVGWAVPEHIHLTLVFLGDLFEDTVAGLAARLDAEAAAVPPFDLALEGVGTFGPPRRPRIVWAGVREGPRALYDLQARAEDTARAFGVAPEARPFKPHVTLGRVRSPRGADALTRALASVSSTAFGRTRVTAARLMRSHLDEPRVRYSILHEASLKGT